MSLSEMSDIDGDGDGEVVAATSAMVTFGEDHFMSACAGTSTTVTVHVGPSTTAQPVSSVRAASSYSLRPAASLRQPRRPVFDPGLTTTAEPEPVSASAADLLTPARERTLKEQQRYDEDRSKIIRAKLVVVVRNGGPDDAQAWVKLEPLLRARMIISGGITPTIARNAAVLHAELASLIIAEPTGQRLAVEVAATATQNEDDGETATVDAGLTLTVEPGSAGAADLLTPLLMSDDKREVAELARQRRRDYVNRRMKRERLVKRVLAGKSGATSAWAILEPQLRGRVHETIGLASTNASALLAKLMTLNQQRLAARFGRGPPFDTLLLRSSFGQPDEGIPANVVARKRGRHRAALIGVSLLTAELRHKRVLAEDLKDVEDGGALDARLAYADDNATVLQTELSLLNVTPASADLEPSLTNEFDDELTEGPFLSRAIAVPTVAEYTPRVRGRPRSERPEPIEPGRVAVEPGKAVVHSNLHSFLPRRGEGRGAAGLRYGGVDISGIVPLAAGAAAAVLKHERRARLKAADEALVWGGERSNLAEPRVPGAGACFDPRAFFTVTVANSYTPPAVESATLPPLRIALVKRECQSCTIFDAALNPDVLRCPLCGLGMKEPMVRATGAVRKRRWGEVEIEVAAEVDINVGTAGAGAGTGFTARVPGATHVAPAALAAAIALVTGTTPLSITAKISSLPMMQHRIAEIARDLGRDLKGTSLLDEIVRRSCADMPLFTPEEIRRTVMNSLANARALAQAKIQANAQAIATLPVRPVAPPAVCPLQLLAPPTLTLLELLAPSALRPSRPLVSPTLRPPQVLADMVTILSPTAEAAAQAHVLSCVCMGCGLAAHAVCTRPASGASLSLVDAYDFASTVSCVDCGRCLHRACAGGASGAAFVEVTSPKSGTAAATEAASTARSQQKILTGVGIRRPSDDMATLARVVPLQEATIRCRACTQSSLTSRQKLKIPQRQSVLAQEPPQQTPIGWKPTATATATATATTPPIEVKNQPRPDSPPPVPDKTVNKCVESFQ